MARTNIYKTKFKIGDEIIHIDEKIITRFDPPPIPLRCFDWSAVTENYEPGCPIGYGYTEQQAVEDLVHQMEES